MHISTGDIGFSTVSDYRVGIRPKMNGAVSMGRLTGFGLRYLIVYIVPLPLRHCPTRVAS